MERLRAKLGMPDAWLVALATERTKDLDRLKTVLDLAQEAMLSGRYAVLPVRYESKDWSLPAILAGYPRIEESDDDVCVNAPGFRTAVPLSRWLRPSI